MVRQEHPRRGTVRGVTMIERCRSTVDRPPLIDELPVGKPCVRVPRSRHRPAGTIMSTEDDK
jgi:hypothetical protein